MVIFWVYFDVRADGLGVRFLKNEKIKGISKTFGLKNMKSGIIISPNGE